jgi:hypothetical protein
MTNSHNCIQEIILSCATQLCIADPLDRSRRDTFNKYKYICICRDIITFLLCKINLYPSLLISSATSYEQLHCTISVSIHV